MKKILSFFLFFLFVLNIDAKDFIYIDKSIQKSDKIALVILNGVGDSKKNRKIQLNFFKDKGMDVFIPDYKQRSSLDESLYSLQFSMMIMKSVIIKRFILCVILLVDIY